MMKRTLVGLGLALDLCQLVSAEDQSTTIDPTSDWGTWEGWGTGLSWWAVALGFSEEAADVAFTLNKTMLFTEEVSSMWYSLVLLSTTPVSLFFAMSGRTKRKLRTALESRL